MSEEQDARDQATCVSFATVMVDLKIAAQSLLDEHADQDKGNHVVGLIRDRWSSLTEEQKSMGDKFKDKAMAAAGHLNDAAFTLEGIVPMLGHPDSHSNVQQAEASAEAAIDQAIAILFSS